MLSAPHPQSPRGRLAAIGCGFGPSHRPLCLHLTLRGRSVGHLDAGEIAALDAALVSGQHDAHCAPHRAREAEAALGALARAFDAQALAR